MFIQQSINVKRVLFNVFCVIPVDDYIHIRKVLKDFLKEKGTTLTNLLSVMDEDKTGIIEALHQRIHLTESQALALDRNLSSRNLNLLLFVIQAFYLINPSGMYKGEFIEPALEDVLWREKITFKGCLKILKALHIPVKV